MRRFRLLRLACRRRLPPWVTRADEARLDRALAPVRGWAAARFGPDVAATLAVACRRPGAWFFALDLPGAPDYPAIGVGLGLVRGPMGALRQALAHEFGHAALHRVLPLRDATRREHEAFALATQAEWLAPGRAEFECDAGACEAHRAALAEFGRIGAEAAIGRARERVPRPGTPA